MLGINAKAPYSAWEPPVAETRLRSTEGLHARPYRAPLNRTRTAALATRPFRELTCC